MSQVRKNLSLDPATAAILDGVENASDYVDRLVLGRERLWRDAIGIATAENLGGPVLLAACDALNGYAMSSMLSRTQDALAFELHDAEELNGVCAKHGVKPNAWGNLVKLVRERPEVAGALLVLVEEFWAGNAACERAMRRIPHFAKHARVTWTSGKKTLTGIVLSYQDGHNVCVIEGDGSAAQKKHVVDARSLELAS